MSAMQRELRQLPNANDVFTDTETRAMLALVNARGGRVTVRSLAADIERSVSPTYLALVWLRDNGLVSWRTNRLATMRANLYLVPSRRTRGTTTWARS